MNLQALVVCSDEKILRVLRRILSELEIDADHCAETDSAVHKLTRQRFEAVIVDCSDQPAAAQVLRSVRAAPCNKRAVAVAIVDAQTPPRSVLELGAHFVLYKPLSAERAKSSFRAVRALMKRERRRNTRIAVEIPVTLREDEGAPQLRTLTTDLGEGGMSVQLSSRPKNLSSLLVQFALPGTSQVIEGVGEVAWENAGRQVGIRFRTLAPETRDQLKAWLESRSPEFEKDDPPAAGKLTDLSLGGCYLEIASPFPVRSRVTLSLQTSQDPVRAEGVVRVMHPEVGMGVEFLQKLPQQREQAKNFVRGVTLAQGVPPGLLVEPEGIEDDEPAATTFVKDDPLLNLFRKQANLTSEAFQIELRQQRGSTRPATARGTTV